MRWKTRRHYIRNRSKPRATMLKGTEDATTKANGEHNVKVHKR